MCGQTCAKGASQATIATCACSSMTLGDIRTPPSSLSPRKRTSLTVLFYSQDPVQLASPPTPPRRRATAPPSSPTTTVRPSLLPPLTSLSDPSFVAFVDLCIQDGLASVTGTVAVGASTSSVSHRPAATGSLNPNMTYVVVGAPTAATAAGLGAAATASGNSTKSAGERTLVGGVVGLVFGAMVVLA